MHVNPVFVPTLAAAILLFVLGGRISERASARRPLLAGSVVAFFAAVPALLFVAFYTHWFDKATWFYAFRAIPYSELAASGLGFSLGWAAGYFRRRTSGMNSILLRWLAPNSLLLILTLLLFLPYMKPLIIPLSVALEDQWSDGVCLQSTPSTCGPSSAATLLCHFGLPSSERELARECFTYGAGTENWYIARALRKRGLYAHYVITAASPTEIPYPSIAGTQIGGAGGSGHFVAVLGREKGRYIIGDPLTGRLLLTPEELRSQYFLTGFFLAVGR